MHEFAIIQSVFETIENTARKNGLRSISKVTLKIGKLRQVVPDFLQFSFEAISENTIAAKAKLIIEEVPVKMRCKSCNQEFIVEHSIYICPKCNGNSLEMLSGKELYIESIEGEQEDAD